MAEYSINKRKIAKNTIALYVRTAFTMIISFFTARITLEQLGVDDYGLNNLVGSIVSMFSFLNGSMGTAVQRFYSIEIGRDDNERLGKVFGTGLYLHLLVALITFVLAELFAVFFLHKMNIPEERMFAAQVVFQLSILSLILNIWNVPYTALLRAREMFSQMALVDIVQAILKLLILYTLIHIPFDKLITLSILSFAITVIYVFILNGMARKFNETHHKICRDKTLIKEMLTFVSMMLLSVFASMAKSQGIVMLINLFFGLAINAAYAIANQVSHIVENFAQNFRQSIIPQMFASYGADDKKKTLFLMEIGTKVMFVLMLAISLPTMFEIDLLLKIWLKEPPQYASTFINLVLININVYSFTYLIQQGVFATGKIARMQLFISITQLFNILLVYLAFKIGLSFYYAMYVTIGVSVILDAIILLFCKKELNYSLNHFFVRVLLPCLIVTGVVAGVLYFVTQILCDSLLRLLIIYCTAGFLIVVLSYYIILNKQEREPVKSKVVGFIHSKKKEFCK